MSHISLEHVYKSYQKNIDVIKDLSLEIFDDEFLVFVGPSGSGKTTTLRMIAGLDCYFVNQLSIVKKLSQTEYCCQLYEYE